jgi:ABC-type multidrug transport system fused ATPase/permease subunit
MLFRGTIADNIRLGDPAADDERVRAAGELAGAHEFVSRLERGYTTVVGEGGRQLSTGQRRRLALARAALRDAPLILLDEPTADLDPANAQLVGDAVDRLRVGRSVLLATHSPDLAARADRVVRLEGGRSLELAGAAA